MNIVKSVLIIFLSLVLTSNSFSQNILYADLDKIMQTSEVGKKIINYFKDKNNVLIEKVNLDKKNLLDKEKSLISQKNILQPE